MRVFVLRSEVHPAGREETGRLQPRRRKIIAEDSPPDVIRPAASAGALAPGFGSHPLLASGAAAILCLAFVVLAVSFTHAAESAALQQIKQDGKIRLGMYLGFEGLSFSQRGKSTGLEVSLADLLCEELSKDLGREVKAEIVNQEWAQIIQELRAGKYHAAFSAVTPARMYLSLNVTFSQGYLDSGPVICCQKVDGKPAKPVTAEVSSLADKKVVVINDPAVRRVLRRAGVYVPGDDGRTELERAFPKSATEAELAKAGITPRLVAVKEIIQLDEMPEIYQKLAEGEVDAGVIDLGIVWKVATDSERWSKKIHAFSEPVGPYAYSAVTRGEDFDLSELLDAAIGRMKRSDKYAAVLQQWHGGKFDWKLTASDFLK